MMVMMIWPAVAQDVEQVIQWLERGWFELLVTP